MIEFGLNNASQLAGVYVGATAQYTVNVQDLNNQPIDFSTYNDALGCGPMLVDQRQVALDPSLEGFTDPALLNPITRRS